MKTKKNLAKESAMTNPTTKIRNAGWKPTTTPRVACLAFVLAVPALVVACGSTGACEDSDYLARTASAAPEDAPAAASTAAWATEGTDPCDSPAPEMTGRQQDELKGNCGCAPGDLMCAMKCSAGK